MKIKFEDISQRAFEIWEREGKPEGCEREHWFQAEEELRKEASAKKGRKFFPKQKTA